MSDAADVERLIRIVILPVMTKRALLARHRNAILALAARNGLADVRIFGSVARGDEHSESDIDVLIRRVPGSDPFAAVDFREAVEKLLACKVDVLVEQPLMRERLRSRILRDAIAL